MRKPLRLLLLILGVTLVADSKPVSAEDPPPEKKLEAASSSTQDRASLELALIAKTLADEEFMAGRRAEAGQQYERAKNEAAGIDRSGLTALQNDTLDLLRADIEYRLGLLAGGYPFRGIIVGRTPSLPINHLRQMEDLQRQFERLSNTLIDLADNEGLDQEKMNRLLAVLQQLDGELQQHVPQMEAIDIRESDFKTHLEIVRGRLDEVLRTRTRLEAEVTSLAKQSEAAMSRVNQLVIDGITQAAGLPEEVTLLTSNAPIEQRLMTYATSNASVLADTKLSGTLGEIQKHTKEVVEYYNDAKRVVDEVGANAERIRQLADALREPTWDSVIAAGDDLFKHLPEEDRQQWKQLVTDTRPAVGVLELVRQGKGDQVLLAGAAKYLATQNEEYLYKAQSLLRDAHAVDLQTWMPAFIRQITPESAQVSQWLTDRIVKIWADDFLKLLTAEQQKALLQVEKVATSTDLRNKLAEHGLKDLKVTIAQNELRINLPGKADVKLPINQLKELTKNVPNPAALRNELDGMIDLVIKQGSDALQTEILRSLPVDKMQELTTEILQAGDSVNERLRMRTEMWDKMVAPMSEAARQKVIEDVARMEVGSSYVSRTFEKKVDKATQEKLLSPGPPPRSPPPGGSSPEADAAQGVMKQALNAAMPGAGLVVDVLSGLNAASNLARRGAEKQSQVQTLLVEEYRLYDAVRDYDRDLKLVDKEKQIARIKFRTAATQLKTYQQTLNQIIGASQTKRARIDIRRPLFFFVAERLREEFDGLDRSMALWMGRDDPQGSMWWLIRSNPEMLRYALDEDIHLFNWLDRDAEANRADVDRLNVYWQQVYRLSKDECTRMGACPGDALLGQTGITREIGLKEILPVEDWKRLVAWKTSKPSDSFRIAFFITPDLDVIPRSLQNVRTVDVQLGMRKGDLVSEVNQVGLRHAGVAYLLGANGYRKEVLAPTEMRVDFDNPEKGFSRKEIAERWAGAGTIVKNFFEGYGLYGLWQIELQPDRQTLEAEDFVLRFAYHFQPGPVVPPEARPLDPIRDRFAVPLYKFVATTKTVAGPQSVEIPLKLLETFGSRVQVETILHDLQSEDTRGMKRPSFAIQKKPRTAAEVRPEAVAEARARLLTGLSSQAAKANREVIEKQAEKEADEWIAALKLQ
jgi:hypothetical protein